MQCPIALDDKLPTEYISEFASYIEAHHTADVVAILMEIDDSSAKHYALRVSLLDLLHANCALGTLLLHHAAALLPYFDDAILDVQHRLIGTHEDRLFMSVKPSCHARLTRLPCCPETCKPTVSSIRTEDVNRLITVSGTVIRTGQIKMLQARRGFMCVKCHHTFSVEADLEQRYQMTLPPECPSPLAAKPCNGTKFEPIEGSEECHDYQEVRIQEQVHRLMVGSIPRSISLLLHNDLVDTAKAGDDIAVVGVLRKRWRPLAREMRCDVEMAIEALHVRVRNEEAGASRVDFEAFWQRHAAAPLVGRDWLLEHMFPHLCGMALAKLAVALSLLGGVGHTDASGMRVRGETHLLLVGDAATGKSLLLRHAAALSGRAVLTTGVGSTSAGLTCTAVREGGGEWMLEAGALVLADGGLCCIDGFESIREHDRATIHEAMEQQTLSVAKAGLVCKLSTRCTVMAATNPKGPRYESSTAIDVNTGLPSPLLSRFDVVLLLRDDADSQRDEDLSRHLLRAASSPHPPSSRWPLSKLRAYLEYAKATFRPTLTPAAEALLVAYFSLQRQAETRSAARTTIRLLEAMVRLAQAHARLMARRRVELQDAALAVLLTDLSSTSAPLLGPVSVLRSHFSPAPDEEYAALEAAVLERLGLEREGLGDAAAPRDKRPRHE
ncbi:hypothetical protein AB1Y20_016257 [Prymnesium parvum]|uniref:DNA helicase n=1 Tax=Prymnesium parvum TaxID=97485 RepID=A0AB34IFK6_PRYPA